jgi:hypothetical protein
VAAVWRAIVVVTGLALAIPTTSNNARVDSILRIMNLFFVRNDIRFWISATKSKLKLKLYAAKIKKTAKQRLMFWDFDGL